MVCDELLVSRIRAFLGVQSELAEKKMFGGVGFLIRGNMAVGVYKENLIVRVGSAEYAQALSHPHTSPFDITGKAMVGWIMVNPQGCKVQSDLHFWVEKGMEFARSLPAK